MINDSAKAVTSLSSDELKKVAGQHSGKIRDLLGLRQAGCRLPSLKISFLLRPTKKRFDGNHPIHYSRRSKSKPEWRNWQTRGIQNPVLATRCGFKSHLRYIIFNTINFSYNHFDAILPAIFLRSDIAYQPLHCNLGNIRQVHFTIAGQIRGQVGDAGRTLAGLCGLSIAADVAPIAVIEWF